MCVCFFSFSLLSRTGRSETGAVYQCSRPACAHEKAMSLCDRYDDCNPNFARLRGYDVHYCIRMVSPFVWTERPCRLVSNKACLTESVRVGGALRKTYVPCEQTLYRRNALSFGQGQRRVRCCCRGRRQRRRGLSPSMDSCRSTARRGPTVAKW